MAERIRGVGSEDGQDACKEKFTEAISRQADLQCELKIAFLLEC